MTAHIPERSLQQRLDALRRANQIRVMRAEFKHDLKSGKVSPHPYLMDPPEWLETMKILEFLLATPKNGQVKVHRMLQRVRIAPTKTLGGMSLRQRQELVALLR